MNTILRHRLAWPVVTLLLLLAINAAFNPQFLHLSWRDGHLYGSLIDILNRAAPLVLVSLGMTRGGSTSRSAPWSPFRPRSPPG
jgi:galactofuranose transport system permease protein